MSRTYKDRPWLIRYEERYGEKFDFNAKPRGRYNGINDNWISKIRKDRGSERASMRNYTTRLKNFQNSFGEFDEHLLEPQTKKEYVH